MSLNFGAAAAPDFPKYPRPGHPTQRQSGCEPRQEGSQARQEVRWAQEEGQEEEAGQIATIST
jgi:hypothetical protein